MAGGQGGSAELTASPAPTYAPDNRTDAADAAPVNESIYHAVAAQEYLSLRNRPDPSSARLKKLAPGTLVRIIDTEGDFSYVEELSTGEVGYAMTAYLVPAWNAVPPTPAPEGTLGWFAVDAEEYLSLRIAPDTSSERLEKLEPGLIVEVIGYDGSFARIRSGGQSGYVLKDYLMPGASEAVVAETTPAPSHYPDYAHEDAESGDSVRVMVVAAEAYLSLRVQPDRSAERIEKLFRGTTVYLLDEDGGEFAHVEHLQTGERGYVLRERLMDEGAFAALPVPTPAPATRYVDAAEYLTLRSAPARSADALKRLARGDAVQVLEVSGEFARVSEPSGMTGWVLDGYLADKKPAVRSTSHTVLAAEYITLRGGASASAAALNRLPAGSAVNLKAYDGAWALVDAGGQSGYVLSGYLMPQGEKYLPALEIVPVTESYSHKRLMRDLDALTARYPGRISVNSAGTSVKGLDIPVVILGDKRADHHVLIQAGIHGREHMTSTLVMKQLEYALAYPDENALEGVCFHILPMTNPDGVAISQSDRLADALAAIFRADTAAGYTDEGMSAYARLWKANANGVDINRNFDAGWKGISGPAKPSSSRYKGSKPEDQPETRALADYSRKYDFDATVSYHAYGSTIFWEYGSDARVLAESRSLGRAVRAVTQYPLAGKGGLDAGGYKDWMMEMRSVPSLTIEIGTRSCPLPKDEFYAIWERNRGVWKALAAWTRGG